MVFLLILLGSRKDSKIEGLYVHRSMVYSREKLTYSVRAEGGQLREASSGCIFCRKVKINSRMTKTPGSFYYLHVWAILIGVSDRILPLRESAPWPASRPSHSRVGDALRKLRQMLVDGCPTPRENDLENTAKMDSISNYICIKKGNFRTVWIVRLYLH